MPDEEVLRIVGDTLESVRGRTYVRGMEWESLTEDQLDQIITGCESQVAAARSMEMAAVAEKRRRQSHHGDGYRSIIDWMAARADISHRMARRLVWTGSRLTDAPEVAEALSAGEMSFDRAEQVCRLPEDQRKNHEWCDISQLRRKVAHYKRLTTQREREVSRSYLNFQSSLDELTVHLWGELSGVDSRIVEKAVDQQADHIIPVEDGEHWSVAERRALALISICTDSLYTDSSPDHTSSGHTTIESGTIREPGSIAPPIELTVTVDARTAAETNGQTGVTVLNGPRIGVQALQAILCDTKIGVIGLTEEGRPLSLGKITRFVPRKLRTHVLQRDGGCTVDGCRSSYRLEIHHITPLSLGGLTIEPNLITLCWYHHHIAIHQQGLQVHRIGPSRIRLTRPQARGPSPPPRSDKASLRA